jgi:uncharacterized membrane protein
MGDESEDAATPPDGPRRVRTHRLEGLSDGVFAIAITLLVLDLAVPGARQELLHAFFREWPAYLAYVVSFSSIGAIWLGHSVITEYLERADSTLLRLNLLLLLFVSFLPFPTRLVAEYLGARHNERVATTIYGLTLLAAAFLLWVLWRYAVRAGLVRPDADDVEISELTVRLTPGLAFYGVLIVLGLFVPEVAVAGYLAVAVYFIVPLHRHSHLVQRGLRPD